MGKSQKLPVAAVVPVFDPEPGLIPLCRDLVAAFETVLVVDDGSMTHVEDFNRLPSKVILLRHAVNCGKGRAIKTAFSWLRAERPNLVGAVFADGDGQHRPDDVVRVAARMVTGNAVVFGVRSFKNADVPFRCRLGNVSTSFLVRMLFGIQINDTQTGLRAIPGRLFDRMLDTPGERYEYELLLFGLLHAMAEPLLQEPIETIYIENNRASHFRPIADTIRNNLSLFTSFFRSRRRFKGSLISTLPWVGHVLDRGMRV